MSENCAICEQPLYPVNTIVTVKLKGLLRLINASLERCDDKEAVFMRSDVIKLHRKCRLNYINEHSIERHKRKPVKHNTTEDKSEIFDHTEVCLLCGQIANSAYTHEQDETVNLCEKTRNTILEAANLLNNNWSHLVCLRLKHISTLEKNVVYHTHCYQKFCHLYTIDSSKRRKRQNSTDDSHCDERKFTRLSTVKKKNKVVDMQWTHNNFIWVDESMPAKGARCGGCAASGRSMRALTDKEAVMMALLSDNGMSFELSEATQFCWECRAIVRRFVEFRSRVNRAQELIGDANYIESLSNIKVCVQTATHAGPNHEVSGEEIFISEDIKDDFTAVEHKEDGIDLDTKSDVFDAAEDFPIDNVETEIHEEKLMDAPKEISEDTTKKEVKATGNKGKSDKSKTEKRFEGQFKIGKLGKDLDKYMSSKPMPVKGKVTTKFYINDVKDDEYICRVCYDDFSTNSGLAEHMRMHEARPGSLSCGQCASYFDDPQALHHHELGHSQCLECHFCRYRSLYRVDMRRHLTEKHRRVVKCAACDEAFRSKYRFKRHYTERHAAFVCDYCGRVARSRRTLAKHISASHLPPVCPVCKKLLPSKKMLWYHTWRHHADHTGPESAYCVECDKQFPSESFYRQHLQNTQRHAPTNKEFSTCPHCSKQFTRGTYLKNHISLFHTKDSKYRCDVCDKQFFSNYALRTHKSRVHDKVPLPKNKVCETCGRAFSSRRILTHHQRTHSGERPHACALCPAAFAQRAAWAAHVANVHFKGKK